jgi:hypothetical protein
MSDACALGAPVQSVKFERGFSRTSAVHLQFQDRSSESGRRVLTGGLSKREALECALAVCKDLAGAFAAHVTNPSNGISNPKSGSKLRALHTLRAILCTCHIENSPRARRKAVQIIFTSFCFFLGR